MWHSAEAPCRRASLWPASSIQLAGQFLRTAAAKRSDFDRAGNEANDTGGSGGEGGDSWQCRARLG